MSETFIMRLFIVIYYYESLFRALITPSSFSYINIYQII